MSTSLKESYILIDLSCCCCLSNRCKFDFSSDLTINQRKIIYNLCEENEIFFEKRGTRYKIIYISTRQFKITRSGVSFNLQNLSKPELPRNEHTRI
ncbi:hypothetical protein BpHYR1_041038 [Brachionus plicatilis]|uniref:Uncharacterized protein n=1 Tax=Brachionus plicatilis TaxID=10195 RepID=A0A3M7Q041_BRAPC|nr:hypothetical protein BpHYR1_041038 [Brachionus plicatilis]